MNEIKKFYEFLAYFGIHLSDSRAPFLVLGYVFFSLERSLSYKCFQYLNIFNT
jgi:hypothetical protein